MKKSVLLIACVLMILICLSCGGKSIESTELSNTSFSTSISPSATANVFAAGAEFVFYSYDDGKGGQHTATSMVFFPEGVCYRYDEMISYQMYGTYEVQGDQVTAQLSRLEEPVIFDLAGDTLTPQKDVGEWFLKDLPGQRSTDFDVEKLSEDYRDAAAVQTWVREKDQTPAPEKLFEQAQEFVCTNANSVEDTLVGAPSILFFPEGVCYWHMVSVSYWPTGTYEVTGQRVTITFAQLGSVTMLLEGDTLTPETVGADVAEWFEEGSSWRRNETYDLDYLPDGYSTLERIQERLKQQQGK